MLSPDHRCGEACCHPTSSYQEYSLVCEQGKLLPPNTHPRVHAGWNGFAKGSAVAKTHDRQRSRKLFPVSLLLARLLPYLVSCIHVRSSRNEQAADLHVLGHVQGGLAGLENETAERTQRHGDPQVFRISIYRLRGLQGGLASLMLARQGVCTAGQWCCCRVTASLAVGC